MSDLFYSTDAMNVLTKFHRCEHLVYVEGDDDILFWEILFNTFNIPSFKIESKDGVEELNKYILRLKEEDLNLIIATDSDYHSINNTRESHPKIIRTIGYSIENTLYVPKAVERIVKLWTKGLTIESSVYESWLNTLLSKLNVILACDIANFHHELYVETLGDNCTRYMANQKCIDIDDDKIAKNLGRIQDEINHSLIESSNQLLANCDKKLHLIVRGHFLQSAVLKYIANFIEDSGKSYKITNASLYTNAIQELERSMLTKQHEHFEYYQSEISRVFKNPS